MLNEQTIQAMQAMKLFGMAQSFEERLRSPQHGDLSHAEFVGMLVQDEKTHRENKRLKRLLKNAQFKFQAAMEDIHYNHSRGLNKQVVLELSSTQWIDAHRNVILTGPAGVGKSWISCALGNLAARAGYTVRYVRMPRLCARLREGQGDGTHLKLLEKFAKVQLLIIDDFLINPLADEERRDIMEIIEDRYRSAATILASQFPLKRWHERIGDPTLADAICDRLVHSAYKIQLRGDSIRNEDGKRKGRPS